MRGDTLILQSLVKCNSWRYKITEEYRASVQVKVPNKCTFYWTYKM